MRSSLLTRTSPSDRTSHPFPHPLNWRALALQWQQAHAPSTTYASLVRSSEVEISPEERAIVRKDLSRSTPPFFHAHASPDFDATAHASQLERVLCAWAYYDQEIGYVQAMNLVASTLLLLLAGDEEAVFWVLVTLLRQLPPQFYSCAALPASGLKVVPCGIESCPISPLPSAITPPALRNERITQRHNIITPVSPYCCKHLPPLHNHTHLSADTITPLHVRMMHSLVVRAPPSPPPSVAPQ